MDRARRPDHGRMAGLSDIVPGDGALRKTRMSVQRHSCGSGRSPARSDRSRQCGRSEEHTSELLSLLRISYAVFCFKNKIAKPTTAVIVILSFFLAMTERTIHL